MPFIHQARIQPDQRLPISLKRWNQSEGPCKGFKNTFFANVNINQLKTKLTEQYIGSKLMLSRRYYLPSYRWPTPSWIVCIPQLHYDNQCDIGGCVRHRIPFKEFDDRGATLPFEIWTTNAVSKHTKWSQMSQLFGALENGT